MLLNTVRRRAALFVCHNGGDMHSYEHNEATRNGRNEKYAHSQLFRSTEIVASAFKPR